MNGLVMAEEPSDLLASITDVGIKMLCRFMHDSLDIIRSKKVRRLESRTERIEFLFAIDSQCRPFIFQTAQ